MLWRIGIHLLGRRRTICIKKNEVVERTNLGESRVGGCQDLHFTFHQEFDRATLLIEDRR